MSRFLAFRDRWAGSVQDICSGCVIVLIIAATALVLP